MQSKALPQLTAGPLLRGILAERQELAGSGTGGCGRFWLPVFGGRSRERVIAPGTCTRPLDPPLAAGSLRLAACSALFSGSRSPTGNLIEASRRHPYQGRPASQVAAPALTREPACCRSGSRRGPAIYGGVLIMDANMQAYLLSVAMMVSAEVLVCLVRRIRNRDGEP